MPATQKTQASITTGETLTAKAFAADDLTTVVQTASAVTEVTDDDGATPTGIYEATFTDLPADDYTINFYSGGTKVADFDYRITLTDATFKPVDLALLSALLNVPSAVENAEATRAELATELARIDENVSAAKELTSDYDAAKTAATQASVTALPQYGDTVQRDASSATSTRLVETITKAS
jgi:hypothetical protein